MRQRHKKEEFHRCRANKNHRVPKHFIPTLEEIPSSASTVFCHLPLMKHILEEIPFCYGFEWVKDGIIRSVKHPLE